MSHFSNVIGPGGPLLATFIGVSGPRQQAMRDAGLTPVLPQIASLLIDTGASHTVIDQRFVTTLGLAATGTSSMHTPSTGAVAQTVDTYDVALVVNGIGGAVHVLPVHSVIACDLSSQGIDGLLGRDILASARLTYSGPDNFFYLSF